MVTVAVPSADIVQLSHASQHTEKCLNRVGDRGRTFHSLSASDHLRSREFRVMAPSGAFERHHDCAVLQIEELLSESFVHCTSESISHDALSEVKLNAM